MIDRGDGIGLLLTSAAKECTYHNKSLLPAGWVHAFELNGETV